MKTYNNEKVKGVTIKIISKIINGEQKVLGKFQYNKKLHEIITRTKADLLERAKRIIK